MDRLTMSDSWTCDACKALMYLRDSEGYPIPGGPLPAYLDQDYKQVCQMCYELFKTLSRIDSEYWRPETDHKPYKQK